MDSIKKHRRPTVIAILVVVIIFAGGYFTGRFAEQNNSLTQPAYINTVDIPQSDTTVDMSAFWKVWSDVDALYVGELPTSEEKVWGAISGLVNSLGDPYSTFFPPKESEYFESEIRGDFQGVGMEIEVRDDILTVIAPLKGTPAEKAGVLAGDRIFKIDDIETLNLTIAESVDLIRGEKGTEVVLTLVHKDSVEVVEVPIIRATIDIPTIDTEILADDKIFVISLYSFSAQSPDLFREALREFVELSINEEYNRLIIDLRNNPGGFLEASVDIASWFLPAGKIVVKEDFGERGEGTVYRSKGYDIFTEDLKLAILINRGSASASEILAGALSQHGKAILVGEKSFGKGSVQQLIDVTENTSLKITVARWLTPNGDTISNEGLTPDIEVEFTQEDYDAGLDPQLDRAILELTK